MHRSNASIIARNKNNQYLIVHKPRTEDSWQFPQGGIDEGESIEAGAIREFTEELGTNKIKIIKPSSVTYQYDFPQGYIRYSDSGQKFKGQCVHFFLAEFYGTEQDITLQPEELDDYKWVQADKLKNFLERKEYLEKIQTAIQEFYSNF